eukprot:420674-Amphidinium_carterae.2
MQHCGVFPVVTTVFEPVALLRKLPSFYIPLSCIDNTVSCGTANPSHAPVLLVALWCCKSELNTLNAVILGLGNVH